MPCLSCVPQPILVPGNPEQTSKNLAVLGAQDQAREMALSGRAWVRVVVGPDEYGVVTIPAGFVPDSDMDAVTGNWAGWIPENTW